MKGKKILITGGAGFIGSHLTKKLLSLGAEVTVVVKYKSIIDNVRLSAVWDHVEVLEADLRNIDSLRQFEKRTFDHIYHLAAYNHVGDSFLHVNEAMMANAVATANLMEYVQNYDKFLYMSTSEVYGYQTSVPFQEDMLPFPVSPYSVGKYAGELYAKMKKHQTGKKIITVRGFNTFGPYQSDRAVIPELIIKCLRGLPIETTKGVQTREFNYVDNIVSGLIAAVNSEYTYDGTFNIGSNREIAIRDLVTMIHKACDSKSELKIGALPDRPTEIWRMCADDSRAQELFGWKAEISFEEGLGKTVAWFKEYVSVFYDKSSNLNKL
ncbi:NAD-dependent epimerase/dehydratase family protein [Leptospira jelokensis]|uniref:NAD-dependent epimerase/dehydratase family protein n=1 Tax=Leptospira jelokensis TaxID=2484931 RepID=A0A4Z1A7F5_9LEPT|nr:GDP-mannose 4,6-dehydratase [Leptospira jelokensis]TGL67647.1 NAD-dependent epimerase/dehydratase family protein [Leptospira jelokensis]